MESQAYNIIQITKQYRIFILPQMLLKWYTNEVISSETSSDQAFAQIFSPVIFVQVTTSLIWSSSLFNHEVYFAAPEMKQKRSNSPLWESAYILWFLFLLGLFMCYYDPILREGLTAFGVVLPSPEDNTSAVDQGSSMYLFQSWGYETFSFYGNPPKLSYRNAAAPNKTKSPILSSSTKIISRAADFPRKHPKAPLVGDYNHVRMFRTPLRCSQKQKTHGQIRGQAFIAGKNFNCKKGEK